MPATAEMASRFIAPIFLVSRHRQTAKQFTTEVILN
jgi:hypothetical protein